MTAPTGRQYAGATAAERAAERRARLIAAGIATFGTTGYRTATVSAVAESAGLIKRYFYESFDSLEALLSAVYEEVVGDLHREMMRQASTATDVAGVIRGAFSGFLDWAEANPEPVRIQLFEVLGVSAQVDQLYRAAIHRFGDDLVALIQQRLGGIDLPETEVRVLGSILIGAGLKVTEEWVLGDFAQPKHEILDATDVLLGSLLR